MVVLSPYAGIGAIFRIEPLSLPQWLGIAGITATVIPVAWLARKLVSKI
jgi:threonine/homoserine efflux transporter RhtA